MTSPSLTSSLTFTFTDSTVPATGEGTSIVALSLSSVIRDCSFSTLSPSPTSTSITGTFSKSPMSGTLTSTVSLMAWVGWTALSQGQPAEVFQAAGEISREAGGRRAVDHAVIVAEGQRQHQPRLEFLAVPDRLHLVA